MLAGTGVFTLSTVLLFATGGCHAGHGADVLATVNGHAIMQPEVERAYLAQIGDTQGQQPSHDQEEALRLNVLRGLIDEEIVEQRAGKMNLTATNEEVTRRWRR